MESDTNTVVEVVTNVPNVTADVEEDHAEEIHPSDPEEEDKVRDSEKDTLREVDDLLPSVALVKARTSKWTVAAQSVADLRRRKGTTRSTTSRSSREDIRLAVIVENINAENGGVEILPLEEDTVSDTTQSSDDGGNILRLQDRLEAQRSKEQMTMTYPSHWEVFINTKWPKYRSAIYSWRGLELWRRDLKYISSHYGSGVFSYYNFLRWLFLVNLLLGIILTTFLVIPQFLWRAREDGREELIRMQQSVYSCILPVGNGSNCSANCVIAYDACNEANSTTSVNECRFSNSAGAALRNVTEDVDCRNESLPTWCLCPREIDFVQGFSDFISGEGIFAASELFIGWYTRFNFGGVYDMPVVYLLVWGLVYVLSLLLIAYRIGSSFTEQFVYNSGLVSKSRRNVCNKVLAGWDFNVCDKKSANLQKQAVKRGLEELAGELSSVYTERLPKDTVKVVLIRIATNTFVLVTLVAGAVAVFYAVDAELKATVNTSLLSTTVIMVVNFVLPKIYAFLADFERYQSPRSAVLVTTLRFLVVRLVSYITLLLGVIVEISCTQPDRNEKGTQCVVDFAESFEEFSEERRSSIESCPSCWETIIGQKFYANAVANFIVSVLGTIFLDIVQNIISRVKWPLLGQYFSREFDVPENIIDLMETQIIFWLGSFFCPMISIILILHLFVIFYVKRYSMQANLLPSKDLYLAAKKSVGFLLILLITGLICVIPVAYAIARLVPSPNCGPFRGLPFIYAVVEDRINELKCDIQAFIGFMVSSSFLLMVILLLVIICLGLIMILYARHKHVKLLVEQLKSESADKSYLLELAKQNQMSAEEKFNTECVSNVKQCTTESEAFSPEGRKSTIIPDILSLHSLSVQEGTDNQDGESSKMRTLSRAKRASIENPFAHVDVQSNTLGTPGKKKKKRKGSDDDSGNLTLRENSITPVTRSTQNQMSAEETSNTECVSNVKLRTTESGTFSPEGSKSSIIPDKLSLQSLSIQEGTDNQDGESSKMRTLSRAKRASMENPFAHVDVYSNTLGTPGKKKKRKGSDNDSGNLTLRADSSTPITRSTPSLTIDEDKQEIPKE